jgi:hypothetical protein
MISPSSSLDKERMLEDECHVKKYQKNSVEKQSIYLGAEEF